MGRKDHNCPFALFCDGRLEDRTFLSFQKVDLPYPMELRQGGDNMKYSAWNHLSFMIRRHLDYLTTDYDYLS